MGDFERDEWIPELPFDSADWAEPDDVVVWPEERSAQAEEAAARLWPDGVRDDVTIAAGSPRDCPYCAPDELCALHAGAFDPGKHPRNPAGEHDRVESPTDGGKFAAKGQVPAHMTDVQKKAYDRGWNAGKDGGATPNKVERADSRREHPYWYVGIFDRDAGNEKYAGVPEPQDG